MEPSTVSFDLSGKVAVVTGGSRGLGRATSFALAAHGATVVVASRKADACEATAAEITAATGQAAAGVACHVGRWADCDGLVERVYGDFGRVDVLVNNAGMALPAASLAEVTEELFDKVLAVNLKGPFRLASVIGTRMAESDAGGAIVNISSVAAVIPTGHELPYSTAKAGLVNLTVGLARALAPNVRVNCIIAGPFLTDMTSAWSERQYERLKRATPLGRAGEPDEIVGAVLYLASPASSFTTGAVLRVDGGMAWQ
ncbi:MAG: glucose 1-dehydrogenase [Actinobacteria bacterium]|nr:glucose 1-dehydrogenase [Actinomycetota bacterium]